MDKEQLKLYIMNHDFEEDFKSLLLEMVDNAAQVDEALYEKIAQTIELQAEFYEKCAELAQQEEDLNRQYAEQMEAIDEAEDTEIALAELKAQEELLTAFQNKLNEINGAQEDTTKIDQLQQELSQQTEKSTDLIPPPAMQQPQKLPDADPAIQNAPANETATDPVATPLNLPTVKRTVNYFRKLNFTSILKDKDIM